MYFERGLNIFTSYNSILFSLELRKRFRTTFKINSEPGQNHIFIELNKLHFNVYRDLCDNFKRSYSQNHLDILTSSDLDLGSSSFKID